MSLAIRHWVLPFVFVCQFALFCPAQETARNATPVTAPADEAALRTLAAAFYAAYPAEDLDGLLKLWSGQAPELPAFKQRTQQQFAAWEKIETKGVTVRRQSVTSGRVELLVELEWAAVDAKTGQSVTGLGQKIHRLECVKEAADWKVWREVWATDELARAVLAAKDVAAREALLKANSELVNTALVWALGETASQTLSRGNAAEALRIAEFTLKLNEQVGDQEVEASVLSVLGVAQQSLGNYLASIEPLRRGLKLREAQQNKSGIASAYSNLGISYRTHLSVLELIGSKLPVHPNIARMHWPGRLAPAPFGLRP